MSSEFNKPRKTLSPEMRDAFMSFTANNTAAPTLIEAWPKPGFNIARTGVGQYTLTGLPLGYKFYFIKHTIIAAGSAGKLLVTSKTPATGTVILQFVASDGVTAADVTAITVDLEIAMRFSN